MSSITIRALRALIVDDYPVNRRLMEIMLTDLGHTTVVVRSGKEALDALQNEAFDFVFLDLQMPEMDGFETARAIRDALGSKSPVLVACSASDSRASEQCREAGFSSLLVKPVTPESLSAVLEGRTAEIESEHPATACWEMPETLAMLASVAGKHKVTGLLELYLKESERRIDLLLKTLAERNIEVFARTAHSLRGSSAQMGAQKMAEISAELEQQALGGEHIEISHLVALAKELERVQVAIKAYLAE